MFVMRKRHMDGFAKSAAETFEDRMVGQLNLRFPAECHELGDEGVRQRIRDGVDRSATYEIRTERDVAHFIRLTFGLGPKFDTARKTSWAREILQDTQVTAGQRLTNIGQTARTKGVKRN